MTIEDVLQQSGKFQILDELLSELKSRGQRVLIFTRQRSTLNVLSKYCELRQYKYQKIVGETVLDERAAAMA